MNKRVAKKVGIKQGEEILREFITVLCYWSDFWSSILIPDRKFTSLAFLLFSGNLLRHWDLRSFLLRPLFSSSFGNVLAERWLQFSRSCFGRSSLLALTCLSFLEQYQRIQEEELCEHFWSCCSLYRLLWHHYQYQNLVWICERVIIYCAFF